MQLVTSFLFSFLVCILFLTSLNAQTNSEAPKLHPIATCITGNGKEIKLHVLAMQNNETTSHKKYYVFITEDSVLECSPSGATEVLISSAEVQLGGKKKVQITKTTQGDFKEFLKLPCIKEALLQKNF